MCHTVLCYVRSLSLPPSLSISLSLSHTHTHIHPARMEVDTVHVVKRIVALLVDSFQPENVSPSQQVRLKEREREREREKERKGGGMERKTINPSKIHISQLSPYQIERCVALLRANQGASRRFYQLAVAHLSVGDVVKFILSIHAAIVQCVKSEGVERESQGRRGRGGGGKGEQEKAEEDMESSESNL